MAGVCAGLAVAISGGSQAAGPLRPDESAPGFTSLGRQVIATIVDLTACWCLISLLVIMIPPRLIEDGFAGKGLATLIPIGLCSVALTYYILFEALFGATLGKAIAGMQVRQRDGDALRFPRYPDSQYAAPG
jgi:uncharacterized RDD family membrane protein YckC